ncbi:MAG: DUF5011 domain-containing protein [Lachnospiraceae bacterium]|nr:DUF5011 domain-containing protein [Lachnospiraceae bacterium]
MKKGMKSFIVLLLTFCMVASLAACGGDKNGDETGKTNTGTEATEKTNNDGEGEKKDTPTDTPAPTPTEAPKKITTIKYGTHYVQGLDPHYVDSATGEFVMQENERQARLAAEEKILEELGVVFEYVQFDGNTTEVLLQSVFAGDPVCDIAVLWGGSEYTVLSQNVCQKLDDYAYIFQNDPEVSWMLDDKLFGHYYLLSDVVRYMQRWPLVYNISMIEAVDSLKDASGNTIYPNTLFDEGKWTWSTFKDYLEKINAYYANDNDIHAYDTDFRFAAYSAAYAGGGGIYGADGLMVNTENTKKAMAYIKELWNAGLLTESFGTYDDGWTPVWTENCTQFREGRTVFTDCGDWLVGWAGSVASERGESIGIVPWPRADYLDADSEDYRQVITMNDSLCLLKGVDKETSELALKALALFTKTYQCELAGVDTMDEVKEANGAKQAASYNLDIFNENVGESILNSFIYITNQLPNGGDYSELLGMRVLWEEAIGKDLHGLGSSYDVAIEEIYGKFDEKISSMVEILSKEGVNDTAAPTVSKIGDWAVIPVGTDIKDPIWNNFISAIDGVEGTYDTSKMEPEFNSPETDSKVTQTYTPDMFNVVGQYNRMFKAYFSDSAGNRGYCTISVIVYDPNNKTAPTVKASTETVFIARDTDVASINWVEAGAITEAKDADGLDISANIKPDASVLDTTTVGTYQVPITVTDYVGNTTTVTVTVEVY